ncbi:MAG: 3'-5' exonuclease [Candidatus Doudnabacteria bacterium]|nr:3'-5' exonuclease [Candidatus Doudnabacteria bacterium]
MNVIFLDTETAGNAFPGDRLVQLAYKLDGGEMVNQLYQPPVPISFFAMSVHHIHPRMLEGKPAFADHEEYTKLPELLKNNILVAHNAEFDIGILRNEGIETPKYICTFKVAHKYLEKDMNEEPLQSRSLQYLRYALDLDEPGVTAHDAEGDVIILEKLFRKLYAVVSEQLDTTEEEIILQHMQDLATKPILLRHVKFGKHKGKTWEEVAKSEPDYLIWLSKQTDLDPNLKFTLKHYLGSNDLS